ncbi:class I SAM-dependent methyltransferase [Burkholderia gladioli]|uniref:class I SAM-dependent methyltransferase n=1 Tax=Burkholderia gladioli TaxID=28095 RepID=UPI00163DF511|nr:class I SAM-dependent methyltransferase [Burkholderia gladioli]
MNSINLSSLYSAHSGKISDKWSSYLPIYEEWFTPIRNHPIDFLEIGVQNGGSLEIWCKYFHAARKIIGCDVNEACRQLHYDDPRVQLLIGDANSLEIAEKIKTISNGYAAIIDDGSHRSGDIIQSFARYFPMLSDGGIYIAEDLHCSYWPDFEGGLFEKHSSIEFLKSLIDILNFDHWGATVESRDILSFFAKRYGVDFDEESLKSIHSISMYNSICVIKKQPRSNNTLGTRIISGSDGEIMNDLKSIHDSTLTTPTLMSRQEFDERLGDRYVTK